METRTSTARMLQFLDDGARTVRTLERAVGKAGVGAEIKSVRL